MAIGLKQALRKTELPESTSLKPKMEARKPELLYLHVTVVKNGESQHYSSKSNVPTFWGSLQYLRPARTQTTQTLNPKP